MKNIYQHNIELEPIRINNADKATFSQKLIDLPYRGYEVEELSDGRKIVITKPGGKSVYGRPKKEDFLVSSIIPMIIHYGKYLTNKS